MGNVLSHERIFTEICNADELASTARLAAADSLQLGRTVCSFDDAAFEQWIRLEVDPGVISFCEHLLPPTEN